VVQKKFSGGGGPLETVQENPKEGVEKLKGLFELFIGLDKSYQDAFFRRSRN